MKLAFCWAHVRHRFYEIAAAGTTPIATEALARIAAHYAIEAEMRGRSADERRAARLQGSTLRFAFSWGPTSVLLHTPGGPFANHAHKSRKLGHAG